MSAGWVAGSTRARLLAGRRLTRDALRELASSASPPDVVLRLQATPYGREVELGNDLHEVERAVAEATLMRLRILAGWLPRGALGLMRALAGWFELANIEDRLASLVGQRLSRPFVLGSLAVAWPHVAGAQTPAALRAALARSVWGDPGSDEPAEVHRSLRLSLAERVLAEAPESQTWVSGAVAILVARDLLADRSPPPAAGAARVLGSGWERSRTLPELAEALPARASWPLEGLERREDLWRAEARWWLLVEREAETMIGRLPHGRRVVLAAAALLAADAHWTISAVEAAARGGLLELEEALSAAA